MPKIIRKAIMTILFVLIVPLPTLITELLFPTPHMPSIRGWFAGMVNFYKDLYEDELI